MKKTSIFLLGLIFSTSSVFAEFRDVTSVICDGQEVSDSKVSRVFFNADQSLFGIGKNEVDTDGLECRVADFYSILITSNETADAQSTVTFESVFEDARRSSCVPGELLAFEGESFESAVMTDTKVELKAVGECSVLEYHF